MYRTVPVIFLLLVLSAGHLLADEPRQAEYDTVRNSKPDTTSLSSAFRSGQLNGMARYFFMATDNKKGLTDYFANALGGGLRYETGKYHGFQIGASMYSIVNAGSFDLTRRDTATGQYNRYEIGLFDIETPVRKKDITRLEEAYVKYNFKRSKIVLGRQLINTPFINLQDGRMRPGAVEGLWVEWNEFKAFKIEGGWLYGFSPRSTMQWYTPGKSIGLYPPGSNPDGTKSQYGNQLNTQGVAVLGVTRSSENLKIQIWDVLTENIFNTAMLQADIQLARRKESGILLSAQIIRQDGINDGGNTDPAKAYFTKGGKALAFGGGVSWKNRRWESSVNFNRITALGRYLMPREWGRDPFLTFMPRERAEGFGNTHAVTARAGFAIPDSHIKTSFTAGYFKLPEITNFRLNKYMMPSYVHLNFDTRYALSGAFKGLEAQFLTAAKFSNTSNLPANAILNKVDMMQYNLVLNYSF